MGVAQRCALGHEGEARRWGRAGAAPKGGEVNDWMRGDARDLQRLPAMACGLYRSGAALLARGSGAALEVSRPTVVAERRLVYLHDHRPEEWPTVQLPVELQHGRWEFGEEIEVLDAVFLLALEPLPPEGWYVLRHAVEATSGADGGAELPARSLVMLGYNRNAEPILSPAQFGARELRFGDAGLRFDSPDVLDQLEPVNFEVPEDAARRVLH